MKLDLSIRNVNITVFLKFKRFNYIPLQEFLIHNHTGTISTVANFLFRPYFRMVTLKLYLFRFSFPVKVDSRVCRSTGETLTSWKCNQGLTPRDRKMHARLCISTGLIFLMLPQSVSIYKKAIYLSNASYLNCQVCFVLYSNEENLLTKLLVLSFFLFLRVYCHII